MTPLDKKLAEMIPSVREERRALARDHGDEAVATVSITQLLGGLRGVRGLVTETSVLDPHEGIRFRGHTIPELLQRLPRAQGGTQPLPEGIFHLLLTGELPSRSDAMEISAEWRRRERLPEHVTRVIDAVPRDAHPMTQLTIGIAAMQTESVFARRYREGIERAQLWEPTLEDAMTLIARLPLLAAYIYRRSFRGGEHLPAADRTLDWAGNFARMLGFEDPGFAELLRLYLFLLSDHEGGNVSAHTVHLVGSALSDPYLALSAGMNGLAGPLHGLANQEALRFILEMRDRLGGGVPARAAIESHVRQTLETGRVIPGYGHAVLRTTDPRYVAQRNFALAHMPDDELFRIVDAMQEIVPAVLRRHGKAKSPWPNVDAHTGVLLVHYGLEEHDFYTVLFGVSRALGTLASLVWDRALGLPIERPKSVSLEWLREHVREMTPKA